jgi:nucleoside-diphosphate-sugar epimerase|tara:strand:+ start:195 stop:1130 length:936 start_codon:yes stop_codon:yes gene_type:complete
MNLLVTGGLGHIGSRLIRDFAKREEIDLIRIFDNLSTQRYCSLFNLPKDTKYQFIEGDINDKNKLKSVLQDIDIVIHLAAITDAPATIQKPEITHQINFKGTENVLNASMKANIKKFIFPSTTSVYGEAEGIVDENYDNYKPSSPYAEFKLAAEKIVQNAFIEHGFHTGVLRMGTIFGRSIGMRFHTVVNKFIYLACMRKPLSVWECALNQKRPYLWLNDAIRAFEFIEKNGKAGELYNAVTRNYALQDIIDAIKSFVPDVKMSITKSPMPNQKSYTVSNKKILDLGFSFEDSLSESIRETFELFDAIKND